MGSNALEQLKRETKDDAKLYSCIKELYEQGVPFSELKALIPDIRRTREQLHIKRMLENNNEVLLSMISKEMSFLLDANSENWTSSSVSSNPFGSLQREPAQWKN